MLVKQLPKELATKAVLSLDCACLSVNWHMQNVCVRCRPAHLGFSVNSDPRSKASPQRSSGSVRYVCIVEQYGRLDSGLCLSIQPPYPKQILILLRLIPEEEFVVFLGVFADILLSQKPCSPIYIDFMYFLLFICD